MTAIQNLFSKIANIYDPMNRLLTFGADARWRRTSVGMLHARNRAKILDLACGTGDYINELHRRFPDGEITGADFTPEMLNIAEKKLSGIPGVELVAADAQNLSTFQNASFDIVSCAFGFRNFPDKGAALKEAARVVKSGGELIVLEFFRPDAALGTLTGVWLKLAAALFARKHYSAYRYLSSSIRNMQSKEEFVALAKDVGFDEVQRKRFFPAASAIIFKRK